MGRLKVFTNITNILAPTSVILIELQSNKKYTVQQSCLRHFGHTARHPSTAKNIAVKRKWKERCTIDFSKIGKPYRTTFRNMDT